MFARPFRAHGGTKLSTYLGIYKKGDHVDIKANGSIHKGMPHRYYHGKTGVVWNVTPRAIGVELNKRVGNRILKKRIHVRVEHVQKSRCREDFLVRVRSNEKRRKEANKRRADLLQKEKKEVSKEKPLKPHKKKTRRIVLKRLPALPRPGRLVKNIVPIEDISPLKYELLM